MLMLVHDVHAASRLAGFTKAGARMHIHPAARALRRRRRVPIGWNLRCGQIRRFEVGLLLTSVYVHYNRLPAVSIRPVIDNRKLAVHIGAAN